MLRQWALLCAVLAAGAAGGPCSVSQFSCRSGECVRADAWCSGAAECADGSDEPPHCTQCNRTYYGRADVGYEVGVRGAARVPFLCHVTLTAGGGAHGDLVQIAFEEFRVGRYEPGALDGCPDGYVQVSELGRPFTGGSWCGSADGPALYYSETSTVTVSVKLFRARLGEPFGLRLRYKFLSRRSSVVRYGSGAGLERGAVSPGTYCTRTYEECHRRACRVQSPNYPGMYPRNATCYWSLRQRDVPTCKHAMLSVRQEHAHKMQIKRSITMASMNKTGRSVSAWGECSGSRDRLIVYDGSSTDDPVLLEYCGGDWLPRVTARGPDMLLAFHSSPYAAPRPATHPALAMRGFELDVDVIFADSDSLDYAREARRCEFHLKASSSEEEGEGVGVVPVAGRGRRGALRAPRHTLPPNTTCTWTFHGRPGDVVWIYFSSFTQYSLVEGGGRRADSSEVDDATARPAPSPANTDHAAPCAVELRMWDGSGGDAREVGRYCDSAPALCARASLANATRAPRPCAPPDGYVSAGAVLSLSARTSPGTATHPLTFSLHYEFVDARVEGAALEGGGGGATPPACARLLTAPGEFSSPRNVLWFGRGGARRLRCVYRVQAAGGDPLTLRLAAAAFGTAPRCTSRPDPRSGRLACQPDDTGDVAETDETPEPGGESPLMVPHLWIYDSPWPGYRVPVACVCDNTTWGAVSGGAGDGGGAALVALGGALELELVARRLSPREDHRHLHFRGAWGPAPAAPRLCAVRRRLPPPGGPVMLAYPYGEGAESECGETPFLLAARGNRSVFVRVWGDEIPPDAHSPPPAEGATPPCDTANRVLVYEPRSGRLLRAVCPGAPGGGRAVHAYSAEWEGGGEERALLVVWAAREPGHAHFSWMEVWRASGGGGASGGNATSGCVHACPTLDACMEGALWCSGAAECPGGADEAATGCGAGARLRAALRSPGVAGALAGGAGALVALVVAAGALRARSRRHKGALGALSSGRLTEELLYDAARASPASPAS